MRTLLQKKLQVITCAMLFLAAAGAIQNASADSLTLEQAIETALKSNPGLKAADAQIEAADAGVLRSASGFLP
jgi:outer membrane protein TolC